MNYFKIGIILTYLPCIIIVLLKVWFIIRPQTWFAYLNDYYKKPFVKLTFFDKLFILYTIFNFCYTATMIFSKYQIIFIAIMISYILTPERIRIIPWYIYNTILILCYSFILYNELL